MRSSQARACSSGSGPPRWSPRACCGGGRRPPSRTASLCRGRPPAGAKTTHSAAPAPPGPPCCVPVCGERNEFVDANFTTQFRRSDDVILHPNQKHTKQKRDGGKDANAEDPRRSGGGAVVSGRAGGGRLCGRRARRPAAAQRGRRHSPLSSGPGGPAHGGDRHRHVGAAAPARQARHCLRLARHGEQPRCAQTRRGLQPGACPSLPPPHERAHRARRAAELRVRVAHASPAGLLDCHRAPTCSCPPTSTC